MKKRNMDGNMHLTNRESRDLRKRGYDTNNIEQPNGQVLNAIILISKGNRRKHESGHPFVQAIGIADKLVDLGKFDLFITSKRVSIDSIGKNIFILWQERAMKIPENYLPLSTLWIGDTLR